MSVRTKDALAKFAPTAEHVDTSAQWWSYWEAFRVRWTGTESLIVIEQDIEITADTVPSFDVCPEPWCTFSYSGPMDFVYRDSLGCARFTASFQQMVPVEGPGVLSPWMHWMHMDHFLIEKFRVAGFTGAHVHGEVRHHHVFADLREQSAEAQEKAWRERPKATGQSGLAEKMRILRGG